MCQAAILHNDDWRSRFMYKAFGSLVLPVVCRYCASGWASSGRQDLCYALKWWLRNLLKPAVENLPRLVFPCLFKGPLTRFGHFKQTGVAWTSRTANRVCKALQHCVAWKQLKFQTRCCTPSLPRKLHHQPESRSHVQMREHKMQCASYITHRGTWLRLIIQRGRCNGVTLNVVQQKKKKKE